MNLIPKLRFKEFVDPWINIKASMVLSEISSGWSPQCQSIKVKDNEWGVLTTSSVTWDGFNELENKKLPANSKEREVLKVAQGDILITRAGPTNRVGVVARVNEKPKFNLMLSDKIIRIRGNHKVTDQFLAACLKQPRVQSYFSSRKSGLAEAQSNISQAIIKNTPLNIPSVDEQQKIGDFLSVVDRKISLLTEKHALLSQYKKGVTQKLFKQEIRFKDDNGNDFPNWQLKKLGDCFVHHNDKNGVEDNQLLSVKMNGGVVPRSEIVGKDNSSEDKSKYLKVDVGDIVYNSMRMWQGASGLSKYNGIVSPAYTVITPKENYCAKYFSHFFKFPNTVNLFRRNSQGLTSDTWNLKFPLFSQIKVTVPSSHEQRKIADFLDAWDKKLDAVNQQIELTQTFKKGLLQQIFV
jgi:type I restriction enzyme, S subunit